MPVPRESSTVLTLIRLAKVIEIVLADRDLTVNQYRMLTFAEVGAPSLRELGVRLVMKPPNVCTMVDGLVERGLVERSPRTDDRRRVDIALTRQGKRLLRAARTECERTLEQLANTAGAPEGLLEGLDGWLIPLDAVATDLSGS
jgi:DNA-binding MarR family transcriptional regulator